jgi:hypothetical protein
MRKAHSLVPLVLAAAAAFLGAASLRGQALPLDLEVGYRWVDVSGNENEYRTQINDRPGVLLRSMNFTSQEPIDGIFDYLHVDASDVGAGPAGQLRFQAGQVGLYRLNFQWRQTDEFSALPAFANPFLDEGIIPGQQTWNRTRNIYDASLELLPGKIISPVLGYTRNVYQGPGTTTYHLGGNEFLLRDQINSVDELYHAGLNFNLGGAFQAGASYGWRHFTWKDVTALAPGAGNGNVTTPILGQDVTADAILGSQNNKINTPTINAWAVVRPIHQIKLSGSYVKADGSNETGYVEADAGNFVSFEIARFFAGLAEDINSRARTDYWRGSARAEITIVPNVTVAGGWAETSRTLDGQALISSLFIDTVTYAGQPAGNLLQQIDIRTAVDRTDKVYDANVTATMLGPFSINGGWTQTKQDVTVTPDAAEIVVPGGQGGTYERTVNTYGGGATFSAYGITLTGDYRKDDANQPIFRTDYISRDRYKFRGMWNFKDFLRIGAQFQETKAADDIVEIGYETKVRDVQADLELSLFKNMLTLRGAGGEFQVNRSILIRVPQNFDIVQENQTENGHTWEGGLTFRWERLSIDGAYLWMNNNGSIPFTVDRARVRAEFDFVKTLGLVFEWLNDKYNERDAFDQAGPLANYNANRYYVGLHWQP